MKPLQLTLKKQWFDMIKSDSKIEEYREIKPYWVSRFVSVHFGWDSFDMLRSPDLIQFRNFDRVIARNGYSKDAPKICWLHRGFAIGPGVEEWGAEPGKIYFILKIGHIL